MKNLIKKWFEKSDKKTRVNAIHPVTGKPQIGMLDETTGLIKFSDSTIKFNHEFVEIKKLEE